MPQFQFASITTPQLAWLALLFLILYFGVVLPTMPKLGRVMDAREDKVKGDIAAADTAKTEADRTHDAYEAEMADAHAKAHAAVDEAKAAAVRDAEAKLGEADAAIHARFEAAFEALEGRRGDAMRQIEGVVAQAAADIVERFGGGRPDTASTLAAASAAMAA